jgi:hypothetical protein
VCRRNNGPPTSTRHQADSAIPKSSGALTLRVETKARNVIRRSRLGDDIRQVPIMVAGQAKDEVGKPIVGAIIYVTNANRRRSVNEQDLLATARTSSDGRFQIKDLPLPVLKPDLGPLSAAEEGRFRVAGTAQGFGFTWQPITGFRPGPHSATVSKADLGAETAFYEEEPIRIDLVLGLPASLHGRLTDDHGQPLAGIPVQVGYCNDPRRPGSGSGTWNCLRIDPTCGAVSTDQRQFNGIGSLPETARSTKSGPDGTYQIDGLPHEA